MNHDTVVILAIIGIALGAIVAGSSISYLLFFLTKEVPAQIEEFFWRRKIYYDGIRWVSQTSELGFPEGKYRNGSTSKGTKTVRKFIGVDHTKEETKTSLTGKFAEVQEEIPIYHFQVEQWGHSHTADVEGDKQTDVRWPDYTPNSAIEEKETRRRQVYKVIFTSGNKRYTKKLSYDNWMNLDKHIPYVLKVTVLGRVRKITPR